MNLHTALPIAVGAGVLLTGLLAWLTFRPEKRRLPLEPAPTTQEIRAAYGWGELPAARPSAHPTNPLPFPIIVDAEPWAEELADGDN